jgi:hypothetical protein
MESRGGVTGGLTLAEALGSFEEKGYRGQMADEPDGGIKCFTCGRASRAEDVHVDARLRIEGASDPADEMVVCAMRCPACGTRGTLVLPFGSRVRFRDARAFEGLDLSDRRTQP